MSAEPENNRKNTNGDSPNEGFSDEERAAMKARAAELKADARRGRRGGKAAADKKAMFDKISEYPREDRVLAERVHAVVSAAAPDLAPKLWYGQPAWAKDGKVLCFFRSGRQDKVRYSVFGFSEQAALDDADGLWATSWALAELSEAGEEKIGELVRKAVG